MVKLLREITPELARNVFRHLSHFAALNQEKQVAEHLWEHVVIQALVHDQGARLGDTVGKIAEIFGLEVEEFEVHAVLTRLVKQRKVREVKSRSSKFYPAPEVVQQTRDEWKKSRELEARVMTAWSDEVAKRHVLSTAEMEQLRADIREFITTMLRQYGAECAQLTGVGALPDVHRVVGAGLQQALEGLTPVSETLQQVRKQELPLFFVTGDEERLEFVRQMTQAMYVLFAVEVDPDLSTLLVRNYAGGHVVLDTNFAYCLLGLDGPLLAKASQALLKYSRAVGYEPVITAWTVEELSGLVRNKLSELCRITQELSPAYMEQILEDPTYADDVFKAFYRKHLQEFRTTGRKLTRQAFALSFQHPEELIARDYGVHVLREHDEWVNAQADRLLDLTDKMIVASANRTEGPKSRPTAEHDARNYLLVHRLRGAQSPRRFVDAKAWLISNDRTLLIADGRCTRPQELPTVILAESWIQMTRLSLPRSINGDAGFASLLAAPYLRNAQVPSRIADIIGGYLALEHAAATQVQVKLLHDKMLTDRLQSANDEEVQYELDQAAGRIAASELEARQKAERELEAKEQVLAATTAQAVGMAQQAHQEAERGAALDRENQKLLRRLAALEAEAEARKERERQELQDRARLHAQQVQRRKRIGIAMGITVPFVLALTKSVWGSWPEIYRVLLVGGAGLLLAVVTVWVNGFMGLKRTRRWFLWVLVNLAIVAGGYAVANVFSNQTLSDVIVTLSSVASIVSSSISNKVLPAGNVDKSPSDDAAA